MHFAITKYIFYDTKISLTFFNGRKLAAATQGTIKPAIVQVGKCTHESKGNREDKNEKGSNFYEDNKPIYCDLNSQFFLFG